MRRYSDKGIVRPYVGAVLEPLLHKSDPTRQEEVGSLAEDRREGVVVR